MLVARCWSLVALSVCVCVCVRGCVGVYLRRCLCCPRICICIGLGTCRSHSCGLCIPSFPWISKRRSFLSRTLRLSVARLISRSVSLALLLALSLLLSLVALVALVALPTTPTYAAPSRPINQKRSRKKGWMMSRVGKSENQRSCDVLSSDVMVATARRHTVSCRCPYHRRSAISSFLSFWRANGQHRQFLFLFLLCFCSLS